MKHNQIEKHIPLYKNYVRLFDINKNINNYEDLIPYSTNSKIKQPFYETNMCCG